MNILLIAPASGKWRAIGRGRFFNGRTFRFTLRSLLSVAAVTPGWARVKIVDEQVEDVPWDGHYDLVGITCMTAAAPRAYELATAFRRRGVPVVLGGMHPTLCPSEALEHSDAVVAGEAEDIWAKVVEDARVGRLGGVYRSSTPPDLRGLRTLPQHLLKSGAYAPVYAVQASRGCLNHCRFCAVAAFSGSRQRYRPAAEVVEELRQVKERRVIFIDDNLLADRAYADALLRALEPLGKRWITQSSLDSLQDEALVRAAAQAGCVGVFVGLETFRSGNLDSVGKGFNRLERYETTIRMLHRHGIGVEAGIVVGLQNDGPGVFQDTLEALERLRVDAVQVSCCTPLPGTPLHTELKGRIIDEDWSHYDFHQVVFRPSGMSAAQLQAGHDWLTREFYRPWRIARRLLRLLSRRSTWRIVTFSAVLNLAYYGRVIRWRIRGANPALSSVESAVPVPEGAVMASPCVR